MMQCITYWKLRIAFIVEKNRTANLTHKGSCCLSIYKHTALSKVETCQIKQMEVLKIVITKSKATTECSWQACYLKIRAKIHNIHVIAFQQKSFFQGEITQKNETMQKSSKIIKSESSETNSGSWQYETCSTHTRNDFKWSWNFSHNTIEVTKQKYVVKYV